MNVANVQEGTTYRLKLAARGNANTAREMTIEWINTSTNTIVSRSNLATFSPIASWTTFTGTALAPAGANVLRITLYTLSSSTGTTGDYVDIDSIMVTESEADFLFADGNSPGWIWNGTPNTSTSTGPPL